jgi:hypothetical protein
MLTIILWKEAWVNSCSLVFLDTLKPALDRFNGLLLLFAKDH